MAYLLLHQVQSLIFFSISMIICSSITHSRPLFWYCQEDQGVYKNGSTYQLNLKQLVISLALNASKSGGFYDNAVGVGSSDQVYGLIMCYADASETDCHDCLTTAANDVVNLLICQYQKAAVIHYDSCLLHYSDTNFLSSRQDLRPKCLDTPDVNTTVPDFLNSSSVQSLISSLTAAASSMDQRYSSNKTNYMANQTMYGLVQCTKDLHSNSCKKCLQNYTAYANAWKSNCSNQFGGRIMGPNCYIRYNLHSFDVAPYAVSTPPPPVSPPSISPVPLPVSHSRRSITIIIVATSVAGSLLLILATIILLRWRRRESRKTQIEEGQNLDTNLKLILNPSAEYQVFDLDTLRNATHNFSDKNKLGQGGFGPVYKGTLPNGQEVAVKRLSGNSGQGVRELKNEVDFLAKLKHKNLVQLLGCCIEKKENILCYEFLTNGSLDKILFARDPLKRSQLDWKMRYKIIEGIGRGLHYLHEESRLKIIHRDLKASNILLDKYMRPKISDFGLARFFGEDQTHVETSIIAGTFGYMAPEYIMHGNFSAKSDVYSFGILLLEIVTGRKNCSFGGSGRTSNLISYEWLHLKRNTIDELKDASLEDVYLEEISKCVHIALLCVQEQASIRPNMESVNHMLAGGDIPNLPSTWRVPLKDSSMSGESSISVPAQNSLSVQSSEITNSTRSLD